MAKTNTGLVAYAKAQVGLPYWYGTYGQTATAALYTSRKKQYPEYYTADDFKSQYGKRVHDCSGLIKGYLWSSSATSAPTYNAAQDKSAAGFYTSATTKGKITTLPKTAGLLVFRGTAVSKITHVGVYDGDGYIYEAKGHAYGVVRTAYKQSDWNYWAQCVYLTDDTTTSTKTTTTTTAVSEKKATDTAKSYDQSIAGTYKATTNLYMRNGAGKSKSAMVILPKATSVKNYGYYTAANGVKWLYVQATYDNIKYTGFCCGTYLKKQ
ncbi:MAG: NlpC/P60 family protein [Lachnospiraceae bacterium]|nr:NlpC/P60 family protein [Lachnospiraceae bacterium]MCD8382770.1 NlpC/P60 family protein [Clostridiales bacterium]